MVQWRLWEVIPPSIESSLMVAQRVLLEGPFERMYYLAERVVRLVQNVNVPQPPMEPPENMRDTDSMVVDNQFMKLYDGIDMNKFINSLGTFEAYLKYLMTPLTGGSIAATCTGYGKRMEQCSLRSLKGQRVRLKGCHPQRTLQGLHELFILRLVHL